MSIESHINRLALQQRRTLSYAFDNNLPYFIKISKNEFIGVHLNPTRYPNLKIIEEIGVWSYGSIQGN